ncbi:MAG: MtnX-like HAD-IB family phosphatase [Chloroflexi bacterium]|nr:MtnX-like HAD-IB family phosphatase [Chloroflexota bacterium]
MNLAILCDFDDTVAVENVAHLLLGRFGDSQWQSLLQQFRDGTIRPKDYFERCFLGVRASRASMQAYVREHAHLRPGFRELARYCQGQEIELAIVTHGLDFYVEALLEREGLGWLPAFTVGSRFTSNGIESDFRYTRDDCQEWGNCKCSVVDRYRTQGRRVFYVGDGLSDLCPARRADLVFARSRLLELCQQEGIPHREFQDFNDVLTELQQPLSARGVP